MLAASASLAFGFAFVLLGGVNVWLVLETWSRVKATRASSRMLTLHRIGGYVFIALFCVMHISWSPAYAAAAWTLSPTITLHLSLAMILSPLLFIKVLIARYYRNQHGLLMPIGLTIVVLAFVLIASTARPYLARKAKIEQASIDPAHPALIDVNQASDLMQRRCSKCHNLDRVVGRAKMRAMTGAGIPVAEARTIISYLASQNQPKGSETTVRMEVAQALVDQRCGRCHSLDRVYKTVETPEEWRKIVTRMVGYSAGSTGAIRPAEDQRIIECLSTTQTPEGAAQRKEQSAAGRVSRRKLVCSEHFRHACVSTRSVPL